MKPDAHAKATQALQPHEQQALDGFRRGTAPTPRRATGDGEWIGFGLRAMLTACRRLRAGSAGHDALVEHKQDGSPRIRLEVEVEQQLRADLLLFEPAAAFVGEETGGSLPPSGFAVAVDPVDGTWAFLGETTTWSCTLAVFRDGREFAGFVANPITGEIAYALHGQPTRHLRVAAFGEGDFARDLGPRPGSPGPALVNLQPSRAAADVQAALVAAWQRGEVGIVRSPGGSPAWSLVEAARGHFVYVNVWSQRPACPYDLAAGALVVRNAGGDVTDLDNMRIDIVRHAGPWVAALDAADRARVTAIVKAAWRA